jgi:hypothetical protein
MDDFANLRSGSGGWRPGRHRRHAGTLPMRLPDRAML